MSILIYVLLVLIPHATSITFNLTNITPKNLHRDIVLAGDCYISNEGIQVAADKNSADQSYRAGRATYISLLHLWDKTSRDLASFATEFKFVIDSNSSVEYADGIAFFLAENNSVIAMGGGLGLPVDNETYTMTHPFVAVEFDTYWDRETYRWDPINISRSQPHVGINVNSLSSSSYKQWSSDITGGGESKALIKYDSVSKILSLSVTDFTFGIIEINYIIDLRNVLPEWVIFGFSAGTGSWIEKNNVKSWSFNSSDLQVKKENEIPPSIAPININQTSSLPPTTGLNPEKGKNSTGHMVGLIAGCSVVLVFFAIFAFGFWRMKKNKRFEMEKHGYDVEMDKDFELGTGPKKFYYHEIVQATAGFVETNKLGEGGFGGVYKGLLKDVTTYVAVKRVSKTSEQGIKEYASEVKIISRLRHKNLVELKGWCHETMKGELLLVYDYMENGSLDLHLFKGKSLLTWDIRYRIANGLASALLYLHHEWEQCILHRDIKSSNVMLDSYFNAKLGDFGLAKLVDHEKGFQTTMLAGTLGYMAPECLVTGKASREADVFSFGVVALEIACGRKPIELRAPEKQIRLIEWVWELYGTGILLEAVDPRLGLDFKEEEIKLLMTLGLWCVHPDSELRPSMRQVYHVLQSEAYLPVLPSKMPVASYVTPHMASSSRVSLVKK